jgi:hypothetical protein
VTRAVATKLSNEPSTKRWLLLQLPDSLARHAYAVGNLLKGRALASGEDLAVDAEVLKMAFAGTPE